MPKSLKKYASLAYALPMVVCLSSVAWGAGTCPIIRTESGDEQALFPGHDIVGVALGLRAADNEGAGRQTVPRLPIQNLGNIPCRVAVAFFDNNSNLMGIAPGIDLNAFLQQGGPDAVTVCPTQAEVGQVPGESELCSVTASPPNIIFSNRSAYTGESSLENFEGKAVICASPQCVRANDGDGSIYAQAELLELQLVVDDFSGYSGNTLEATSKTNTSYQRAARTR